MIKAILKSMRLRTLPLSMSGILMGAGLAAANCGISPLPTIFLVLTAAALQVLSNLSNELGDTLSGTDTDERAGIHYSLQDGTMTVPQMKRLIGWTVVVCCLSGLVMVWTAFGTLLCGRSLSFLLLGAVAVYAAMHYTLGRHPYGYRGLGDVSVFVFFGLATVLGGWYLSSGQMPPALLLLPAAVIGCFSVGVLNVNNIRDMKTDAATRTTVALKLGEHRARIYQTVLICAGWLLMLAYCLVGAVTPWRFAWVLSAPLFMRHLRGVWARSDRGLDPMLPLLVMSSFVFSLLAVAGALVSAV